MRRRWSGLGIALLAAAAIATCGGGEDALIESYFKALKAGDVRGLETIASVQLDEEVEAWTRLGSSEEKRAPVTLPELTKRYESAQAEFDAQREKSSRYALDHLSAVDKVQALQEQEKKIPAELQEVAEAWAELSSREEELKAALAEAREAMQREKRVCEISAGEADDLGTAAGEVLTKEVELSLTIGGEAKPYVMTLRRYMLEETDTPHEISRWIVYDLKPKG